MAVLPANWPTTGGNFNGANMNTTEAAVNANPAKAVATVVAVTPLPAGVYNNAAGGVGATFTVTATGTTTVDSHVLALNELVLVAGQVSAVQNGLYIVTVAGAGGISTVLTRATVMNSSADFPGSMVIAGGVGGAYANTVWLCTATGAPVIGTNLLPFVQPQAAQPVVTDATTPASLVLNTDTFTTYKLTSLANACAITATGGHPTDDESINLVIKDNGTPQALSWGAQFAESGVARLPSATTAGKKTRLKFIYDAGDSTWRLYSTDLTGY